MKTLIAVISFFTALLLISDNVYANKTSVSIDAPDSVKKGTEITIKINVSHSGNNRFHHTDWVWVKADGKEIARWEFTGSKLPEDENFIRAVKVTVNADTLIEVQGNCNIHGSDGIKSLTVKAGK